MKKDWLDEEIKRTNEQLMKAQAELVSAQRYVETIKATILVLKGKLDAFSTVKAEQSGNGCACEKKPEKKA